MKDTRKHIQTYQLKFEVLYVKDDTNRYRTRYKDKYKKK